MRSGSALALGEKIAGMDAAGTDILRVCACTQSRVSLHHAAPDAQTTSLVANLCRPRRQ